MIMKKEPVVVAKEPVRVELTEGQTYFWCSCGRSKSQPFCDGSHKETGLSPVRLTAEKSGTVFLCQCKASAKRPYCDGTHQML